MSIIAKLEQQEVKITLTLTNKSKAGWTAQPYQFEVTIGIVADIATIPAFTGEQPTLTPPSAQTLLDAPYLKGPLPVLKNGQPMLLAANESFSFTWPTTVSASGGWQQGKWYRVRVDVRFPTTGAGRVFFSDNVIQLMVLQPDIEITGMTVA